MSALLTITLIIFQANNTHEDRTGVNVSNHAIAHETSGARAEYYSLCQAEESCCLEHAWEGEGE